MSRKKRSHRIRKADPRPLIGDRTAGIEVRTLSKEEQDRLWLEQNYAHIPAPDPIEVPETSPETLRLMNEINKARKAWADVTWTQPERKVRMTPYVGPRFVPPTPSYLRRTKRFAQR
ncbi:hypothetical protein [Bradyrhizobium sp. SZCCHNR3118]|uniref:hypothetical protein n=1 Tax=Bradyrhizobium sp. SZCCHNR3118 TaxID=3057468 RepID=UPI002915DDA9|nr:hypothetical protein [Bradyrhizobium sp. SZCCHNR3118]